MKGQVNTLADIEEGQTCIISSLYENVYTCKLLNLGMLPGESVQLVRKAPFGDAFYVKLKGYQLAIRKIEAETVKIESV